ncbi:ATP-dependent helicase HrpB [Pseudoroseomonas rhizosphaerae]|uniref:RNA helicase n=1 Tax=Teichococcus rhizosphaerae TaxID=1335062 RepID=A0A2C7ACU9_9PROT|nr:ATP-dependent helicase HrpB [Pseudoroseomonas rhizosphaerae]PHK94904.1 ATP-dependent helicase HrpB [Pseudoroseomonas rhizosphaerae]
MDALPPLPVTEALPRLLDALRVMRDDRAPNAVLVAPPGAGKTTLVPLALRHEPWAQGQKIVVLEPRRVAARAAARRMADLLGEKVGQTVGLATRLERAVSAATRIEVVTEGLLVRRLQTDPGLEGTAAVLFDEAHERNLDTDLALALCLDLQRGLRPELRLLAMSATIETEGFSRLMGGAPVIESLGRAWPVAVHHRPRDIQDPRDLPEAMASAIRGALVEHPGDVLAFLPGWGEIRRTAERLGGVKADVLPLHGELPPAEQDRALNPSPNRKVVLATSIAETSLTVPGVRIVVDGGFRRAPRLDPATGLARLATLRISRASAEQRAGRAGRTEPGVAIRLWTEALHRGLPLSDRPEILESELSGLALDCAAWGGEPEAMAFLDPPPAGQLAAARALLRDLDALDAQGRITAMGRRMARLGTHPRLARMMAEAADAEEAALAAELAALLEERDPIRGREAPSDIQLRLDLLHGADDPNADRAALGRIRRAVSLHRRRLGVPGGTEAAGDAGLLLAAGFPDRIAARRGSMDGAFRLAGLSGSGSAGGQGARLPATDRLGKSPLLAVADLELAGTEARIRMAAPLTREALERKFPERLVREEGASFDARAGAVVARRRLRLGPLVLEESTLPHADPAALATALAEAAAGRAFRDLDWTEAARQFRARIARMHALEPEGWPDVSDAALAATAAEWLAPWLSGMTRLAQLRGLDVVALLRGLLPHAAKKALDAALPPRLALPNGRAAPIDYAGEVPRLEARAQWLFGLSTLPPLAGGRIPLQVALLSPAGRPIAVTADLPGFWRGAWADVRKDMRGRYPRHDWPEDPARAG